MTQETETPRSLAVNAGSESWTPLHIELMIHYRCSAARFARPEAPAVIDYTQELIAHGLVEPVLEPRQYPHDYRATEKGEAFLEMICRTPLPRLAWVTPAGDVVTISPNTADEPRAAKTTDTKSP